VSDRDYQHDLALVYNELGMVWYEMNRLESAQQAYQQAIAIEEKLLREHSDESGKYRNALAASSDNLARVYRATSRYDKSEALSQRALDIYEKLARDFPNEVVYQRNLAIDYVRLEDLYQETGRTDKAEAPLQHAVAIREKLVREHPYVLDYLADLADIYNSLGLFQNNTGNPQAALPWYDKSIQTLQRVIDKEPRHSRARRFLTDNRMCRAIAVAHVGDHVQAAKDADELARQEGLEPVNVYNVACVYSRCLEATDRDAKLSPTDRTKLKEHYARQALDSLRQAFAKGYKNAAPFNTDPDLDPLRNRKDFKKLMREFEEQAKAEKAKAEKAKASPEKQ
jgi:tetratricopeptide (TPR) repeat protein